MFKRKPNDGDILFDNGGDTNLVLQVFDTAPTEDDNFPEYKSGFWCRMMVLDGPNQGLIWKDDETGFKSGFYVARMNDHECS